MFTNANFIKITLSVLLLLSQVFVRAQGIRGVVLDGRSGEPMTGATVMIRETGQKQFVALNGSFYFKSLREGSYELEVTFANYKKYVEKITVLWAKPTELKVILQPEILELSTMTVVGGTRESDRNTRNIEKNSNQLVNVVSSRSIQLLPDITVANVLQRVSGVTIERNSSGEARYPIIRGMEKRYINTLVNGIKIPSPDDKSRFIPLDLFPSELLERLEVSKSLTPSMEGDAIGGTINLVMKDAPSNKLFQVNASVGYNNIFAHQDYLQFGTSSINKWSPAEHQGSTYQAAPSDFPVANLNYHTVGQPKNETFGLTAGNRFGKEKRLGVLVSASYQNIYSGVQSTFFLPNAQPGVNNIPSFIDLYHRVYSNQNQRLGLNAKLDYRINERNKISLINTYVRLNTLQVRQSSDTIALNSLVDETFRSTWQYQSIYNSTLQGFHQMGFNWALDWSAGYSVAANHIPDQATFGHEFPVLVDPQSGAYHRGTPDILIGMSRNWEHNSDKDWSGQANLTRRTKLFGGALELKAGGLARDKKRDNFYNAYSLSPLLPSTGGNQFYSNVNNAQYTFKGGSATPALNGNNYTFTEDVFAGYIQGKWQPAARLELLGGVRAEYTHQEYNTQQTADQDARSGKIWYMDWLPSGQVKYSFTERQSLRLSYYKAIARPQFAELIHDGPDNFETFKQIGNPQGLKHASADNLDLRYEWFPGNADQVLLGVFYKNIKDPIEYTAIRSGSTSQVLEPQNVGNATNYGFEAVYTRYFGVWGISANYTYTQSKVTTDSMQYSYRETVGVNAGSITSKFVSETRPLQGQSNHIGNLSLLYKSSRLGLDAQLALTYTGERIALVTPYAGLHYWQQPFTGLDLSFEKRIIRRLTFYGKMNNLTNAPLVQSLHVPYTVYLPSSGSRALSNQTDPGKQIIVQRDYIKTGFLFGLRYKW